MDPDPPGAADPDTGSGASVSLGALPPTDSAIGYIATILGTLNDPNILVVDIKKALGNFNEVSAVNQQMWHDASPTVSAGTPFGCNLVGPASNSIN